jgi:ABC-type branched-subunit amino acid transport system substrate-binding protein
MMRNLSVSIELWPRLRQHLLVAGMTLMVLQGFGLRAVGQESVQFRAEIETQFQQALVQYSQGNYRDASSSFDRLMRAVPLHQRTTASYVMKAKAQLGSGLPLEAVRTLRSFLDTYPGSSYVADAEYTIGIAQTKAHRYDDALAAWFRSWSALASTDSASRLRTDLIDALDRVIDSTRTPMQMRTYFPQAKTREQRAYVWLKTGELSAAKSDMLVAENAIDTLKLFYGGTFLAGRIAALQEDVNRPGTVKIGLLLPLMKKEQQAAAREVGEEMLEGIQFAVEEYNRDSGARRKVTVDIRDTERDPLVASRETQMLTDDPEILAIIGPVFSSTTAAAVGLANARGVPLVTPTANSNGIAATGRYVFQASPDYETRGKAMARFAFHSLGHRRFAVLAPIDTYAKFMAEAFIAEAIHLGARVVATEWFKRGDADFTMQMRNIRRGGLAQGREPLLAFGGKSHREDFTKLMQLGVPARILDSLAERSAVVSARQLLGPDAGHLIDSLGITVEYSTPDADSLEDAVYSIDGFYVPVSMPEEIGPVVSQVAYFNIKTQLLGSGEWNNFGELDANKRYCESVYFESDNQVNAADPSYGEFVDKFFQRFRKRPTRNSLYGYDTARLLLTQIRAGASSRQTLANALAGVTTYQGLHSPVGFSPGRVNSWLQILHFDGNTVRTVEKLMVR